MTDDYNPGLKSNAHSDDNDHDESSDRQHEDVTIIVNGREKTISSKELSFAQLVTLAFEIPPTGENIVFTMTYRRGQGDKPEGSLVYGEAVKIKKGMIFNVTATDKS
jgi:hypothetical protein